MKELALIVEDDFDIGTIFAEALKMSGYETEIISDGQARPRSFKLKLCRLSLF